MKTLKEFTIVLLATIAWLLVYDQAARWDLLDTYRTLHQYDCAGQVKIEDGLVFCVEGNLLRILGVI